MNEKMTEWEEWSFSYLEAKAINQIKEELKKAKSKWPDWVFDPVHAAAILDEEGSETIEVLIKICEKTGKTMQAALDFSYSNGDIEKLRLEACQTGAMAIRLLENLDKYERVRTYINQNNEIKQDDKKPNWFGYKCKWLCAKWKEDEYINPNYKECEPVLVFCNHPENKSEFEGNCNKKMCPLLNQNNEVK